MAQFQAGGAIFGSSYGKMTESTVTHTNSSVPINPDAAGMRVLISYLQDLTHFPQ